MALEYQLYLLHLQLETWIAQHPTFTVLIQYSVKVPGSWWKCFLESEAGDVYRGESPMLTIAIREALENAMKAEDIQP